MLTKIKAAALSGLIALGSAALPAVAHADNVYLGLGGQAGSAEFGIRVGDDDWRRDEWRGDDWRQDDWRRDNWRRADRYFRGCTPERAVDKAWRMGVRNPRVVDVDRRTIEVRGRKFGHRVNLLFARAPHCPVIG